MPHRVIDTALDGLAGAAVGLVAGVASNIKGAGEQVSTALDKPTQQTIGVRGPHRIADALLDAGIDSAANFYTQGIVKSIQIAGEGIAKALDEPLKQLQAPQWPGLETPRFLRGRR